MKACDNMKTTKKRSAEEIRYAQLWAEIELPKLLKDIEEPSTEKVIKNE
jgi:hypothetical protein